MHPDLQRDIVKRLKADYAFKERKEWLREGKCPSCAEKSLYVNREAPWVVRCGRLNNCGWEAHAKDLFKDLFESWSDRFKSTPKAPHAAADAYLSTMRGFDLDRIRGWYTQEWYRDHESRATTATVRFPFGDGWWERLIDRPWRFGDKKARFAPGQSYMGRWWVPHGLDLAASTEIWITEGIFDAIALWLHGVPAVSAMSCNNYPAAELDALRSAGHRPTLVWALDGNAAGREYTLKWVKRAREAGWECRAAQIEQTGREQIDWNELHLRDALTPKHREEYLYLGDLLLAKSAVAKGLLMWNRTGRNGFHLDFRSRLYWFELDLVRYQKAKLAIEERDQGLSEEEVREQAARESGGVVKIANCVPVPLYYQANRLTDESWYYYRIDLPKGRPVKNTFTGAALSSASEFKKRLLAIAPGAMWTGTTQQLDHINDALSGIKVVETIDFIGYSAEHSAYIFGDLAVQRGKVHRLNDEDYFDLANRLSIKTLAGSPALAINRDDKAYRRNWFDLVWRAYGPRGAVVVAFWTATLFAEQIRERHKSLPFLEVVGEPGSGKSTLIEFLWRALGRDAYEGFDPSKSTAAGRARNFAQVSNLPVVLIESERDSDSPNARPYDWDEVKTLYNGRAVRSVGVKNNGNDTREPPFRGGLVISQNAPVAASQAVLERIVHVTIDKSQHTAETVQAARELENLKTEDVSGYILAATTREAAVMETYFARAEAIADELSTLPVVRNVRLAKNHGQLAAMLEALRHVLPISDAQIAAARAEIDAMVIARQAAISRDHPHVERFWEVVEYLEEDAEARAEAGRPPAGVNHSRSPDEIAINLNHLAEVCANRRVELPLLVDLKRYLRTSKRHKFIDVKSVNSRIHDRTTKCWVFQR